MKKQITASDLEVISTVSLSDCSEVSVAKIKKWESGKDKISADDRTLIKLAENLKIPIEIAIAGLKKRKSWKKRAKNAKYKFDLIKLEKELEKQPTNSDTLENNSN